LSGLLSINTVKEQESGWPKSANRFTDSEVLVMSY
jgi:hypothetical protein